MTAEIVNLFPDSASPADPLIGRAIALDQPCAGCGGNVALVSPGRGPHAAALRCRNCDRLRQWIGAADYAAFTQFITEIDTTFGVTPEIAYSAIKQRSKQMEYDNTNRGVLFRNAEKENPKHADFRGEGNIGGTDVWINGWTKTSKKGTKFLSLSFKPKKPAAETVGSVPFNDEIPFLPEWR